MPAYNQTSIEVLDLPRFDKLPEGVPAAFDSMSLAHALGVKNRTIRYLVAKRSELYKVHTIPKKSGGVRTIHAPDKMLKFVQGRILERILNVLPAPDHVAAYVQERSTRYSAELHAGKPVLTILDLKDFFPSTRRSWVRHALQGTFGYPFEVASLLADIMTVPMMFAYGQRYVVPQGAPTSGAICNWVANQRLDTPLLKLCEEWDITYTRYADDLAFSSSVPLKRGEVNKFVRSVTKVIQASKYTVNKKKTRVTRSGRQQRLLGMTINEKPNVMRHQYRKMRARLHHCETKGFNKVAAEMKLDNGEQLASQIKGTISYYQMINPEKAAKLAAQFEKCGA
jgi:RNA-directed DNA polymerase